MQPSHCFAFVQSSDPKFTSWWVMLPEKVMRLPNLLRRFLKSCLIRFGNPERLEYAGLLIEFESWCKTHQPLRFYHSRNLLYSDVNQEVLGGVPVDYLEFGVYKGDTILYWAEINKNAESRFFGFDSFEGLPEPWGDYRKGFFSTGGASPSTNDRRVSFVKGWFQDTIPGFLKHFEPRNRLVVHVDADLYSSTLLLLTSLDHFLIPGTVLIFDEFFDCLHEFRALRDYASAFRRKYRPLYCTDTYKQVAVILE
jgi:O-methyltransferase